MFCRMLGSIYSNLKASAPIFWNNLICQPFYFGDSPELTWLDSDAEANLEKLIYYEKHERLRTVRVFRFYDKNGILSFFKKNHQHFPVCVGYLYVMTKFSHCLRFYYLRHSL